MVRHWWGVVESDAALVGSAVALVGSGEALVGSGWECRDTGGDW